ncbi:MAG: hypothetical protein CM1200mP36_07330 [Gammaproteobacteria bacterium]|nr:MAG: hypothetical protein CM1200mP36_07330 [Gammaproteobacteria bacterium]
MDEIYEQIGLGERLAPVVAGMLAQQVDVEGEVAAKRRPLDIAGTEGGPGDLCGLLSSDPRR